MRSLYIPLGSMRLLLPRFLSPELRAEIEHTPSVVLGQKNTIVEDEVDALVVVVSNVVSSTLVGDLFELLRSGGSHSFRWAFMEPMMTTIPVETSHAQATWGKTESFVILSQTLYPRILRRMQVGCNLLACAMLRSNACLVFLLFFLLVSLQLISVDVLPLFDLV